MCAPRLLRTHCTHTPCNVSNDAGVPLCLALVLHTFVSTWNISPYECHWCRMQCAHSASTSRQPNTLYRPYLFSFNIFHNLNLWSTKNFHFFSHSNGSLKLYYSLGIVMSSSWVEYICCTVNSECRVNCGAFVDRRRLMCQTFAHWPYWAHSVGHRR